MLVNAFKGWLTGEGRSRRRLVIHCWLIILVILLAHLSFQISSSPLVALGVICLLGWALPGWLLALNWRLPGLDWAEAGGISIGLGLAWGLLLAWAVHMLPGPITARHLLSAYEGGVALLMLILLRRPPVDMQRPPRLVWAHLLFLLVLAACLRLPGLGYAEFHIDETLVLNMAYEAIVGRDDIFLTHEKGPAEIVATMVPYVASGTMTEATARLPFALSGIGTVMLVYLLGRRLFRAEAGLAAGMLLVMNGYALSLSRIAQYQGLVLLFMTLSFFAAYGFAGSANPRWLSLVGLSSGVGMLAHYESAMIIPTLLMLIAWGWRRSRVNLSVAWQGAAVFLLIVLMAYAPLVVHPHFSKTERYVTNRLGAGLNWNGPFFVENNTLYNSIYYFVGLLLLLLLGIILGWRYARLATAALILWFVPFLGMYMFVVTWPGTHFYTMMVSWCLLGGFGLIRGMSILRISRLWWAAVAAVAVWCAVCVGYLYLVFFQQRPEYIQDSSANRVPLYWAPYGDAVPLKPRYGFPNQAGWKVIGLLFDWNYFQHTYKSSEYGYFLEWYLRDVPRERRPDYYFLSQTVQVPERDVEFDDGLLSTYLHVGEVRVHGEPKIQIYARDPAAFPYLIYEAEIFTPVFDRTIPVLPSGRRALERTVELRLGDSIWLRGFEWDARASHPGDVLHVILYWGTSAQIAEDYKVFAHLGEDPIWGQHDAMPQQNTYPTSQWDMGKRIADHVLIPIKGTAPPGTYPLVVGMYREEDGRRLPAYDANGRSLGHHIVLGTISIY